MTLITRKKIDVTIEKRIVLGMAVSTEFLFGIQENYSREYFLNPHLRKLSEWFIDYFNVYQEAPDTDVQNVFLQNKTQIKVEEADIIEGILKELSDLYKASGEATNAPFLIDTALQYFKKQELLQRNAEVAYLLEKDEVNEAENVFLNIKKIAKLTNQWINPLDDDHVFKAMEDDKEEFLLMPGALGKFIGNIKRGWLVGISAPFKRGKTFFALDMGVIGMLLGMRVAVISLEMSLTEMTGRIIKRFVPSVSVDAPIEARTLTVFDCKRNQTGECDIPQRYCRSPLFSEDGTIPDFRPNMTYEPCTYCKDHPEYKQEYKPSSWFIENDWPTFDYPTVATKMEQIDKEHKNKIRFLSFPKFSANVQDIYRSLEILERTENFIPDILIVDYVDILKEENENIQGVAKEDRSWTALSALGQERKMVVVTPTQVTREGLDANIVRTKHSARWIGKVGHVDVFLALNQTAEEKKLGFMRVGMLAHRHKFFGETDQVSVLQNIYAGQTHLDSF